MSVISSRHLLAAGSVLLACAAPEPVRAQSEPEIVRAALERRDAAAARAVIPAWDEAAARARAWAPELSISGRREESLGRDPFTTDVTGFGAGFELSDRNRAAREAASARAGSARAALEGRLLDIACDARALALEAWAASREAALLASSAERGAALRSDLAALVEAGELARFDLDLLDAELSVLQRDAWRSGGRAAAARQALEARTGLAVAEPVLADLGDASSIDASSIGAHPAIAALEASLEAARAESRLARGEGAARLDVEAGWRRDDAPGVPAGDGYEVGLAVTLPSRSLSAASLASARVAEMEAAADLEAARAAVLSRAGSALASLRSLAGRDASPPREVLVQDARARYLAGEGSLAELLSVIRAADGAAIAAIELELDRRHARLELDCATGFATSPEFLAILQEMP